MFIETGTKQNFAVKRSGNEDRVNASSRFPLLLTAPEVFVLSGYKHSSLNGVAQAIKIHRKLCPKAFRELSQLVAGAVAGAV